MLRWSRAALVRVLCLTMIPDGGAMTPALKKLGYEPYTIRTSFKRGHASTHPMEWAAVFEGTKRMDMNLFGEFDALVGPPAAALYDRILPLCPPYTKVILVEEPNKEEWCAKFDRYIAPLLEVTKRRSRSSVGRAFHTMVSSMTVNHDKLGRAAALDVFEERVKAAVPADRLLVYRHGDGWEPLCRFLERPLPKNDEPFPPYDDGMYVVGNLQERLLRAEKMTYLLGALMVCSMLYWAVPSLEWLSTTVAELKRDYAATYGSQMTAEEAASLAARSAATRPAAARDFDARWERLGGTVRTVVAEEAAPGHRTSSP